MYFSAFLSGGTEDSPSRNQRRRRRFEFPRGGRIIVQPSEVALAGTNDELINLTSEETTTTSTMSTTAQQPNNSSNNNRSIEDDENDTNDCPICLCPLSNPWGVCTPCGHAYCRGCWDQLTASHVSSGQRRRGSQPSCAVCKTGCKEFVTVFVDLNVASSRGTDGASGGGGAIEDSTAAAGAQQQHDLSQAEEYDDKLDQLTDEWDKLWKELEALHPEIVSSDDSKRDEENTEEEDDSSSDWDHGQREVAAICANFIDLTQTKSDDNHDDDDDDSPSQLPISSRQTSRDKQMKKKALQQREEATHTILRRLKQLHCEIMQLQLEMKNRSSSSPSSCSNITAQQTQKLRSKVIKLQSKNADLTSQLQSLQSEFDNLEDKMESCRTKLTERTIETEAHKRNADEISSEFKLMEQSYQKHVSKSNMEQTALKSDIRRLQDQITKLSSQSGLQDLQEMEEIRRKYSKMSQDVHSLRSENTRLTKRLEDERAVWRRELGREKANCQRQMELTTRQSSEEEEEGKVVSGDSSSREKSSKSRKLFSLDGRRRDQQTILTTKKPSESRAVPATSFGLAAFPPSRPTSKDKPPNKSKAMDILDSTRSRKHSLQQNSLMMSVKRTKTTSFAKKARAPKK